MPNPTRQEILDAHDALKHLISYDLADAYTEAEVEEVHEREQLIRKFLPPKPQPTMAEVEWDDEKHCLREAEHPEYGKVIMLFHIKYYNQIAVLCSGSRKFIDLCVVPEDLTPTGKRYTLTEVQDG